MAISTSRLVNATRLKNSLTEKGMITNSTSLNACVDMFFMAGSARHWSDEKIQQLFQKALSEDPLSALKLMFWARDVRGGAGERRFFRVCLKYLEKYYKGYLIKNMHLIPEYGRWDDMIELLNDGVTNEIDNIILSTIKEVLYTENTSKFLLSKWMDRKGWRANKIRKFLKLSPKDYRKLIVGLSNTVEQLMCKKEFDAIEYEHVPSLAMNKYRKAFYRNDQSRFSDYINDVQTGVSKMCAGAIYPYQLYDAFMKAKNEDDNKAIEAQWYSMPNYMDGSNERLLPMVDTSGSMGWYGGLPGRVAQSLAIYISERNEGIFRDAFITFSTDPQMMYLKGTVAEKIRSIGKAPWKGTTNFSAAFDMILSKAVENKLSENDMPTTLLVLSDMQFDPDKSNYRNTSLDMINDKYAKAGYKMPRVVYWNLRAEENNVTASVLDENVGLISGFSPTALKSILIGKKVEEEKPETPLEMMFRTIDSERYEKVTV